VSGFSAEWLALREPADAAARSDELVSFIATEGDAHRVALRLIDLGGGTGANIRYLSAKLPLPQHWVIVDDDPELLARAPAGVARRQADLNAVVDDTELFHDCDVVTASALLDLVSDRWLIQLVERCRAAGASVLFALNFDGRITCEPPEPEDKAVRRLVNRHQERDKGFGPALGPASGTRAATLLMAADYDVRQKQTDWQLGAPEAELQRQLIAGWTHAAVEMAPGDAAVLTGWKDRRIAHVNAGRSRIVVGHVDVAGVRRA
jgi:trans-aconitate methyltransferase